MRLQISRTKNAESFYVVKSVYEKGKRTNIIYEKLGTLPEVQAKAVAVLFGCSAVLVGDDDIWAAASLEGRFAIGRFDNGDEDNHLFLPVFGRVLQYLPENEDLFKLSSHPDKTAINNLYTADTKMCAKVLNASGVYVFDGVGA